MTDAAPDELTWLHIRLASDAAYGASAVMDRHARLAKYAGAGAIRTRASRVTKIDGSNPIADFGSLPPEFWSDSLEHLRSSQRGQQVRWTGDTDWYAGVVEGFLSDVAGRSGVEHVRAYGVQFCVQDLDDIFGMDVAIQAAQFAGETPSSYLRRSPLGDQTANKSDIRETVSSGPLPQKGGNPGKVEVWHRFWFEAMTMLDEGNLADRESFPTQRSLMDELRRRIDDKLSEDSVKQHVSRIWLNFVTRGG